MGNRAPHRSAGRLAALVFALALIAAACGGDDAATTTTVTPSAATTVTTSPPVGSTTVTSTTVTAAPSTTTGTTTPTSTEAPTTTTEATTTTLDINALASGSGCTPGTDALPDGEWFGFVDTVAAASLQFDLACWFTGDAAVMTAAEDGFAEPPPNDYYVRNVNTEVRTVAVAADAQVDWLPAIGPPDLETIPYADWVAEREGRGVPVDHLPGAWLTVEDGEITMIVEQYTP